MGINVVKCLICDDEIKAKDVVAHYVIKGEDVYLCKGCGRIVKDLPDDHDKYNLFGDIL